jgi:short-chain fatty acids transporter
MSAKADTNNNETMLSRFNAGFAKWATRWVPDALVFALVLTVIVFFVGWGLTKHGPIELVDDWVKGFWMLLTFAMQMSLLMVTGFAFADAPVIKRGLMKLIDIPKTRTQTILFYAFFMCIIMYIHWGIGLVIAIIMGRELAVRKRGLGIHYTWIAGVSYAAAICDNGPSQAAQLLMATPGNFMEKVAGIIPLSASTFNIKLIITNIFLLITTPLLMWAICPRKEQSVEITDSQAASFAFVPEKLIDKKTLAPAERWDRSLVLPLLIGIAGLFWIIKTFYAKGLSALDLNTVNFIFLILAILLHGSPKSFITSVQKGTATIYGVVIQFPLYAGIFGMISFSGLSAIIANFFISISNHTTFTWVIFVYTGILDFFVPSAGSKFVIEAPYILPAAKALGVSAGDTINAYTAGSLLANMIQPFWALPILGAFQVKFKDILPVTFFAFIWMFITMTIALFVLPLIF